jgi:enoyl-CoA hydratase/carnithine racemase
METWAVDEPWVVDHDSDGVCLVSFHGGERRTMGIKGAAQFAGILAELTARPEPPVLVVENGILHAELGEVLEMGAGRPIGDWLPWIEAIGGLESYPSTTIIAIPDQASCGGLELSLAADLRIAAPTAEIGVLEARLGLIPGAGGTQRLPRLVGPANAALLCYLGETVNGVEAHRMGLVQLLADDPVERSMELAHRLVSRTYPVLAAVKRALIAQRVVSEEGFKVEGRGFLDVVAREHAKSTMESWMESQSQGASPAKDKSWINTQGS